jgi:hypothetical protein
MSVNPKLHRGRRLARQRFYEAFKLLRAGETIAEFPFRLDNEDWVALDICPYADCTRGTDFYLVGLFMCFIGRGQEAGPRICQLCFKDTGDPWFYGPTSQGFQDNDPGQHRIRITCPSKHIYGYVRGGVRKAEKTHG